VRNGDDGNDDDGDDGDDDVEHTLSSPSRDDESRASARGANVSPL
jgi:hypothetical protein